MMLLQLLIHIVQAALFTYCALLAGNIVLRTVQWREVGPTTTIISVALGYGILALIATILAACGILDRPWLYAIAVGLIAASWRTVASHLIVWTRIDCWIDRWTRFTRFVRTDTLTFGLVAIWVIIYAAIALLPSAMGKDGLAYHIPFAVEISDGRGFTFPIMGSAEYGHLPIISETLYASTISLFNNLGVLKLLQFAALLLIVFGMLQFSRRFGSSRLSSYLLAGLLLASTPLVRNALSGGMVDIWAYLWGILGILLLVEAQSLNQAAGPERYAARRSKHILAGILIGLALGTKYLSLFFASIGVVLIIVCGILKKESASRIMRSLALYVVPAIIVGGFWYAKNMLLTGNPFFPIFEAGSGVAFAAEVNAYVMHMAWYNFFVFPFYLFGKLTYSLPFGIFTAVSFLTAYALFAYLAIKQRLSVPFMATFLSCQIYLGFIFIWSHQIRFIIPALMLNSLVIILGAENIFAHTEWKKPLSYGVAAIMAVLLIASVASFRTEIECIVGTRSSGRCYQEVTGGAVYATRYANEHLEDTVILEYWNVFYRYSMKNGNSYSTFFCSEADDALIGACLRNSRIRYYLDDTKSRGNPWMRNEEEKLRTAGYFLRHGTVIFEYTDVKRDTHIRLFQLPL